VRHLIGALLACSLAWAQPKPLPETGFRPIMNNWDCDPAFWRFANDEIIGETTKAHQPAQNTFCIWKDGKPGNFELRLQYKLTGAGGNSGVQYRSVELPDVAKWVMKGYQADIDGQQEYTGQIYEERARGFLALRGQICYSPDGGTTGSVGTTGDGEELKRFIRANDWNDLAIVARGNTLIQMINGHVMSVLIDDDKANRRVDGEIGIQLHKLDEPMKIEARNIRIKIFTD
jgi:hypothetical protein